MNLFIKLFSEKTIKYTILILLIFMLSPSFSYAVGSKYFDFSHSDLFSESSPSDSPIKLTLKKEESKRVLLILRNTSIKTVSLHLYIENAFPTNNGGLGFPLYSGRGGQSVFGLKYWSYIDRKITIEPKKRKKIIYTIPVPRTADVGEHISGLIVEDLTNLGKPKKGQFMVAFLSRAAIPIFVKIPGKVSEILKLAKFGYKKINKDINFYFTLKNTGNVHLKPKVTITIRNNITKQVVKILKRKDVIILPQQKVSFDILWQNAPLLGSFTAKTLVRYGNGKKITRYSHIIFLSKFLIVILVISTLLLLIGASILIKKFLQNKKQIKDLNKV